MVTEPHARAEAGDTGMPGCTIRLACLRLVTAVPRRAPASEDHKDQKAVTMGASRAATCYLKIDQ